MDTDPAGRQQCLPVQSRNFQLCTQDCLRIRNWEFKAYVIIDPCEKCMALISDDHLQIPCGNSSGTLVPPAATIVVVNT